MAYYAHESACIDQPPDIGEGSKIWHFSHIMAGSKIGQNCNLGQNVFVADGVVMGNNVKVQNNVAIYHGTLIEDDVFLGPSCVLTNISNPRSQIVRRQLYETTLLRRGCSVGANATIVCGTTIGRYAFISAGAVVTRDVPDYALVMGVPGRQVGWVSRHGHRLPEVDDKGRMVCPESGLRYKLEDGAVMCLDVPEELALPEELAVGRMGYQDLKGRVSSCQ